MQALMRLSALFEERGEFYANANARVSLESMSLKLLLFCF
jgi:shikimate kinase